MSTSIKHVLSVRTDHSLGESILQVGKAVEHAHSLGYETFGVTDTMSISSMVDVGSRCQKLGMKSIIGCVIRVVDDPRYRKAEDGEPEKVNHSYQLKVYVKSDKGLRSLMKLLTKGNSADYFYYVSRVGLQDVLELEDVIVTTGDMFNIFHHPNHTKIIQLLSDRFGTDNVFIEVVPIDTPLFHTLNEKAIQAASTLGKREHLLVGYPVFYKEEDDANSLDVLRAITSNRTMDSRTLPIPFMRDLCFAEPRKSFDRMAACGFESIDIRIALANMQRLVSACDYTFKKLEPSLPKMAENEFLAMVEACKKGWSERFANPVMGHKPNPEDMQVYKDRLAYELGVIKKLGFANYFLVVQNIVNWSKEHGVIVGPGRGSCFLPGHMVALDKSGLSKKIEDFKIGDFVLAHDGSTQEVIDVLTFERDEEMLELEFDNGINIKCTKDHKFYTKNRGWVEAQYLDGNDEFDDVRELAKALEPKAS